jgi:hypothetical protein
MERSRLWMWIGFLVIVLAVLLFLFWPGEAPLNWDETYRKDSRQPYGTQVIFELVKEMAGQDRFFVVEDSLIGFLEAEKPANYVFLGTGMWLDTAEQNYLLDFIRDGNTALLITTGLPEEMLERLFEAWCPDAELSEALYFASASDTGAVASLLHPGWEDAQLELACYFQEGKLDYDWAWFDPSLLCETNTTGVQSLGMLEGIGVNFLKINLGDGALLLHTTPLAFSNFFVKENAGLVYAERVLSYLNEGPVYWDYYSDYESVFRRGWGRRPQRTTRTLSEEGPLQYILSQPPLAWAWYTALITGLLYLLFRAKRRQRIIPIQEPNTNTSMEFIATIGQLYFQQQNHRKLALLQWKLFLGYVRDRYHMPTRERDDAFIQKLSERSGIGMDALQPIFRLAHNIERSEVFLSENTLIDLNQALDHFYRNCK